MAELLDLCDDHGNPLGRTASRSQAHRLGLWHRTVHCWIMTPRGEILLQKRAANKESHPGLWDVSAAGHITAGDTSLNAAVREMHEELGIVAEKNAFRKLFEITQCFEDQARSYFDHEITDVYLLRMEVDAGALKLDSAEVEQVRLMPVDEFFRELREHPERFSPHGEEYGFLIREIGERKES